MGTSPERRRNEREFTKSPSLEVLEGGKSARVYEEAETVSSFEDADTVIVQEKIRELKNEVMNGLGDSTTFVLDEENPANYDQENIDITHNGRLHGKSLDRRSSKYLDIVGKNSLEFKGGNDESGFDSDTEDWFNAGDSFDGSVITEDIFNEIVKNAEEVGVPELAGTTFVQYDGWLNAKEKIQMEIDSNPVKTNGLVGIWNSAFKKSEFKAKVDKQKMLDALNVNIEMVNRLMDLYVQKTETANNKPKTKYGLRVDGKSAEKSKRSFVERSQNRPRNSKSNNGGFGIK